MPWEPEEFRASEQSTLSDTSEDKDLSRRLAARRFYREAPPYCVRFEDNGTVSLRRKRYEYWDEQDPEHATTWVPISTHDNLEEAERRLRLICSAAIYYDDEGKPVQPPRLTDPQSSMPPTDDE